MTIPKILHESALTCNTRIKHIHGESNTGPLGLWSRQCLLKITWVSITKMLMIFTVIDIIQLEFRRCSSIIIIMRGCLPLLLRDEFYEWNWFDSAKFFGPPIRKGVSFGLASVGDNIHTYFLYIFPIEIKSSAKLVSQFYVVQRIG